MCERFIQYIPITGLSILLQENRWTDRGNIKIAHRLMNVEIGTEATQLLLWEYINQSSFAVYTENIVHVKEQSWKFLNGLWGLEPRRNRVIVPARQAT